MLGWTARTAATVGEDGQDAEDCERGGNGNFKDSGDGRDGGDGGDGGKTSKRLSCWSVPIRAQYCQIHRVALLLALLLALRRLEYFAVLVFADRTGLGREEVRVEQMGSWLELLR